MEQHPIPQNITGYQFRLVGDMTLKQFAMLAGGIIVALLFYYSPFPAFFKFPFVIIFGLGGIALAFFPINDIPLDRWTIVFFKSIYSPTQFFWKKNEKIPEFLETKNQAPIMPVVATIPTQAETVRLSEYLGTLLPQPASSLEKTEKDLLDRYSALFQQTTAVGYTAAAPVVSIQTSTQTMPIPLGYSALDSAPT